MQEKETTTPLFQLLQLNASQEAMDWLGSQLDKIISSKSARDLYLTYSLSTRHFSKTLPGIWPESSIDQLVQFKKKEAQLLEAARIYLLIQVLIADAAYFSPKVANLIQVADRGELETFLKYLNLLPGAEAFKQAGVEALRTNIASVFDAITLDNEYPAAYFNDQQWNQMYLKAAFMQRDLSRILHVDQRANKELARIVSDYAHERWSASRDIDPLFWRPVSGFLEGVLLEDMEHLMKSENPLEKMAGALCCYQSVQAEAQQLLDQYPDLRSKIENGQLTWQKMSLQL